jgi:hypothetical protein
MAHDEPETTYDSLPLIVRIFETIREITIHVALWSFLLINLLLVAVGICQLLF